MRHLRNLCFLACLLPTLSGAETSDEPSSNRFCWPLNFAGVVAGTTNDAQVVRLLGPGVHRPNEEEGVRYYVDRRHRATLRIATYTMAVVGEISVSEGIAGSLTGADRNRAVSPYFDPAETFGNWHALKLGSLKSAVLSNLGKPASMEGDDAWVYEAACTCELPEYLTLYFRDNKVVRVVFAAPPG